MTYFSRLTDIITCNLSDLILRSDDPREAIKMIIAEIKQGIGSAERSLQTAERQVRRLDHEISETHTEIVRWDTKARSALEDNNEGEARICLIRRKESRDLHAGLEQQKQTAITTLQHLQTTYKALQARLCDAERRQALPDHQLTTAQILGTGLDDNITATTDQEEIESELSLLKREMGK
jgi:phage shock protein A